MYLKSELSLKKIINGVLLLKSVANNWISHITLYLYKLDSTKYILIKRKRVLILKVVHNRYYNKV
jgi:hypothetical protein